MALKLNAILVCPILKTLNHFDGLNRYLFRPLNCLKRDRTRQIDLIIYSKLRQRTISL